MSLKYLTSYIANSQVSQELIKRLDNKGELNIIGSSRYAKALVIDALATIEKKNILLICSNAEVAYKWYGYFQSIENKEVLYYPPNENLPYEARSKSREVEFAQLDIINKLINLKIDNLNITITTERSLQPHLLNRKYFKKYSFKLEKGNTISLEQLTIKLTKIGYKKSEITTNEGQWSRRGDIVDIFPVNNDLPIRLEFFDNNIEKIREYDHSTQKTLDTINIINISPAGNHQNINDSLAAFSQKEVFNLEHNNYNLDRFLGLIEDKPNNILNFTAKNSIIIFDELEQCKSFTDNWFKDSEENFLSNKELINTILSKNNIDKIIEPNLHANVEEIYNQFKNYKRINLSEFESSNNKNNRFLLSDKPIKSPFKDINKISKELNNFIKDKNRVIILSAQPFRTNSLLNENECYSKYIQIDTELKKYQVLNNQFPPIILKNRNNYEIEGFVLPIWKFVLITDRELYAQQNLFNNIFIRKRTKSISSKININKINPGDYIVHKNHGIGRFLKIEKINIIGESRDYLVVQYLDGKISVAADQLGSISKYRSSGNLKPKINKLGGTEWEKVKERNKKAIQKIAIDLLKLYAQREKLEGYSYPPDGPWQIELEDSFPHMATPDQIKAVKDIKKDMESSIPMDRLICGDVGYGKTEVAIRAIFKAITSGKQVILLAPTTILAQQHWKTINNRFAPYPIKISLLNRFKKQKERKEIYKGLKNNNIDLVVATHLILAKEVELKNLGLLVIDEEQRFGVKQKEKIKKIKNNVDVLTLTATPIPRTLYMSLSGIRQMSLIETPPPSRRSIKTYLSEIDMDIIRTAINQELDRGGQIFYVLPRISDIEQAIEKLKNMFSDLKFIVAHGQMDERDLENAMINFNNGDVDLMICTTIIESGLDIPKVNTIIIEDAHKFGLSQLYQLRGRVGRSGIQAHAWLFYPNINKINESSKQRLKAIKDFSELGSGYQLAMKDMEIRGVGSILGEAQSGQVNNIGYDLYMEMLQEAISDLNGKEIPKVKDTQIDLPINAFIPGTWISNRGEKLEAYKNATECSNNDELTDLAADWVNRYGLIPKPVETLLQIMNLKLLAKKCGFIKIKLIKPNIIIETKMESNAFKLIKKPLPANIQNKFIYQKEHIVSKIIIRGIGVLDSQNQIDNLIIWLKIMAKVVDQLIKTNKDEK